MTITKSEYLLFLKHRTWFWLKKNAKHLLPPIDASTQAKFDAGNRLEEIAYNLFPQGTRLGFNSYQEYQSLGERTKAALAAGETVLFQARFDTDRLTCLTDVIEITGPNRLKLYEIKSSTKAKPEHEYDLAFQTLVLEELGFQVEEVNVIHINRDYRRGSHLDPAGLFTITPLTEAVRGKLEATKLHLEQAMTVARMPQMPHPSPRYCRLNSLYDWLPIFRTLTKVPERSIYDLMGANALLIGTLEDQDITLLQDIPLDLALTDRQRRQISSLQNPTQIDRERLKQFLDQLVYPLYFLDYETCSDALPPYEGTRPYQQIPCQYSLHIIEKPGGDLRHTEFLHRSADTPIHALTEALKKDIGTTGSIIVWYQNFESSRNTELAELLPAEADFFQDINQRMVDLMLPFSEGAYQDPGFMGSSSIKKVLPVLVPELSYKELVIQEGGSAQRLWMEAALEGKGSELEREEIFANLLRYCELDTLAMVKIYEKLLSLV